jgi:nucleoside-diphosphate-sugar epimerase
MVDLAGKTVVVVGVTGQVATPLAKALAAKGANVVGAARFTNEAARAHLEASGIRCVTIDLESGDVKNIPADADYVVNFAVAKTNDWDRDLDANVGGTLSLMEHVQHASAYLQCSSTAVYKPMGHHVFDEEGPYGDNHGVWGFLSTYSTCKIASESAVRWGAKRFNLPSIISRLSVPYGPNGGWPAMHLEMLINGSAIPVHTDAPSTYHPIHDDDIAAMVPGLLEVASVPVTTVNWGGAVPVSVEEWCSYLGEITGLTPEFVPTDQTIDSVMVNLSRLHSLVGETQVPWRQGMADMVAARHPELLKA